MLGHYPLAGGALGTLLPTPGYPVQPPYIDMGGLQEDTQLDMTAVLSAGIDMQAINQMVVPLLGDAQNG